MALLLDRCSAGVTGVRCDTSAAASAANKLSGIVAGASADDRALVTEYEVIVLDRDLPGRGGV